MKRKLLVFLFVTTAGSLFSLNAAERISDTGYSMRICGSLIASDGKLFLKTNLNGANADVVLTPYKYHYISGPFNMTWAIAEEFQQVMETVSASGPTPVAACAYSDHLAVRAPHEFVSQKITIISER